MPKLNDRQGQIPPNQGLSLREIKGFSLDAAGTLIQLAEPVGISYSRVAESFDIHATPEALERAFRLVWKATPAAFSPECRVTGAGKAGERDWWYSLVDSVFRVAGATGPVENRFHHFFDALYEYFASPGTWLAADGAKELTSFLTPATPAIVLSNFDGRLRRILADLDLLAPFKRVVLSSEVGVSKPDPAMFREAHRQLGVPPENILHIGDDPIADWEGARAAGFQVFRVAKGQGTLRDLFEQLSLAD